MTSWNRCQQWLAYAILSMALTQGNFAFSQESEAPTVHWAYASYFGTGWYRISEQQSAFIASFAPRWLSGDVDSLDKAGREAIYTLRIPVTVGVAQLDFEDVPGTLDPENFSTVSAGLGADIDLPVSARLSIRPSVQLSYGTAIGRSDSAWTYRSDLRARYTFRPGKVEWSLIGIAGLVGYDASAETNDSFTYAALGAEFAYPVSWFDSKDDQTLLYWHVLYTDFLDRMEVESRAGEFTEIVNYWQVGFAIGKKDKPIRIWFLEVDRLGLAYDVSPSGELRGLKFVFGSLYDP